MNRLEVRGVIVPSGYDQEWAADYIAKGIITPESRFRSNLEAMKANAPLELHINSPGGSVFAGNEMINAINDWIKRTGQSVEITVGAMAASMAAAMVVSVNASKVKVHKNSKIMFHGAFAATEGGAEAHKDEAELLTKINNDLKAVLVSRYKLSPEQVDSWFAEGRAGWLTADDAVKAGIAAEIIDAQGAAYKMSRAASAMLSERGLRLAAALETEVIEQEVENVGKPDSECEKPVAEVSKEVAEVAKVEQTPVAATPEVIKPADVVALNDVTLLHDKLMALDQEKRTWQGRYDKAIAEINQRKVEIENYKLAMQEVIAKSDAALKAEQEKAAKELEKQSLEFKKICSERDDRIAGLESRLTKFTFQALELHSESAVKDWPSALKACNGDYVEARKKYPGIYQQMMATANRKGKR